MVTAVIGTTGLRLHGALTHGKGSVEGKESMQCGHRWYGGFSSGHYQVYHLNFHMLRIDE